MRSFILTRIAEKNGKFDWNFNINSISNNINNIMDFPHVSSQYVNRTLFIAGAKSNYIT